MAKKIQIPIDKNILNIPLEEAMPDNYLPYAVEVAKERALPDVRDGLKPVQRRIVYGSYMLKAFPDKPYYKSARIVGDILGKYHPHGDSSVYDAMVILAQNFTTRMPIIDGHGNWGSQDGDSAAAMRYTEARLTPMAMELIADIDKDVVNMVDNYSGSEKEPKVLPAKYPNILVNGAFGIAVGLATNIPPHNLGEVIDGTLAYIDNNEITTQELLKYIKGPDLPTGGVIIGKKSMLSAYETGEGRVTLRAKTSIEQLDSGRHGIVITEFPFRKSKAKLLQTISEMTADKRHAKALESIFDIRDESDRNGIRSVIEFKKSATKEVVERVLKYLYKRTDLQINISFNMVALADGKPKTLSLRQILMHYVNHQKEVITRRTNKELQIAKKRFEIVQGFIKAISIMDEVIKTIRQSKSKKDAGENLVSKYGFTKIQSDAILELMLYRLTGLEIEAFEKEYKNLEKLIKKLSKILESEKELLKVIKKEMLDIKEKYQDKRRTDIIENDDEAKIDIEEIIVDEDIVVTMSNEGFIKRTSLKSYNRTTADVGDIEYREGDFNKFILRCNTKHTLMIFTNHGNVYKLKGINIPEYKFKDKGERIETLIKQLNLENETIVDVHVIEKFESQNDFMLITNQGYLKKTPVDKFDTSYTKLMALKLKKEEKLLKVYLLDRNREEKFIKINTKKGLSFTLEEPKLESVDRNIVGYKLCNLFKDDLVLDAELIKEYEFSSFYINLNKTGKIVISSLPIKTMARNLFVDSNDTLLIFNDKGVAYYIPCYMLQNLKDNTIEFKDLIDEKINIVGSMVIKEYNKDKSVYFITKKGLVKRTILDDLKVDSISAMVYKFKEKSDEIIDVICQNNEESKDILMITKRAMAIRFKGNSINPMGKIASGVTGVSLKELDEVIFACFIEKNNKLIKITTKAKEKCNIEIEKIKVQNRAGIGNALTNLLLNDYIEKIKKI